MGPTVWYATDLSGSANDADADAGSDPVPGPELREQGHSADDLAVGHSDHQRSHRRDLGHFRYGLVLDRPRLALAAARKDDHLSTSRGGQRRGSDDCHRDRCGPWSDRVRDLHHPAEAGTGRIDPRAAVFRDSDLRRAADPTRLLRQRARLHRRARLSPGAGPALPAGLLPPYRSPLALEPDRP